MEGRRLIIPDVHGCGHTLQYLLEQVVQVTSDDYLYFLGDYIDRGPANKQAVDYIMQLREKGYYVEVLMGNHEDLLLNAIEDPAQLPVWLMNGGDTTLRDFGIEHPASLPDKYVSFFKELKHYIELEDAYLVHAGFNFRDEDIFADRHAMLWIRGYRVNPEKLGHKKLIHGHTPIPLDMIQKAVRQDAIELNLDNGCVYNRPDMHNLLCLNLDTMHLWVQPNIEGH